MKKLLSLVLIIMVFSTAKAQHSLQQQSRSAKHKVTFNSKAAKLPKEKTFYVQSALTYGSSSYGYWDFPTLGGARKDMRLLIHALDNGPDRKFKLKSGNKYGYYEIAPISNSNLRLDIAGGNNYIDDNGNKIIVWDRTSADNQQFKFVHLGGGKYKIYTPAGHAICTDGRRSGNGTAVNIWEDHDGLWMEWYLIDARTKQPIYPENM